MPTHRIDWEIHEGVLVVHARGEFDVTCVDELRSALAGRGSSPHVVVDLSAADFVDSSVLGVLVRARRRAGEVGGEVWLVTTTPSILAVLDVTGLDTIMNVRGDLAATLAEITSQEVERETEPVDQHQ